MAVKFTKPEINVREKLAELDKPSGIAGEAMLRAETPQEQFNLIGAGRKNKIVNGSMLIWQRGTVQTTSNNNSYHCVDRWAPYSSGRTQYQQSTDVPDGFAYALATSGTPTGEYIISHGIELPRAGIAGEFYVGQKFTVSYYAKSTVTGDRLVDWMAFRVGQTSSSSQVEAKVNDGSQYHSLSTGWKRYSRTYTITGTPGSTNICVALAIRNHWDNPVAAGNISITGVQVEIGSTATPFEHRSYGEELALCQRYYQLLGGAAYAPVGFGKIYAAGNCAMGAVPYITEMRAPPSVAEKGNGLIVTDRVAFDDTVTSLSEVNASTNCLYARFNTGLARSDRHPVFIACRNGAVGWLELDAEL
jgi:hypothetical protein